jgi:hypothetical protein
MPTLESADHRRVRDEFLGIILADQDLLGSEFEALVQANPTRAPVRRSTVAMPSKHRGRPAFPSERQRKPSAAEEQRPKTNRQRSPPA